MLGLISKAESVRRLNFPDKCVGLSWSLTKGVLTCSWRATVLQPKCNSPEPADQGPQIHNKLLGKYVGSGWSSTVQDIGPSGAGLDTPGL